MKSRAKEFIEMFPKRKSTLTLKSIEPLVMEAFKLVDDNPKDFVGMSNKEKLNKALKIIVNK